MAKVFSLLQKLPPSRRLKLLQDCFSQTHRLALEAWVLAYRDMHKGQRLLSVTEPETASFSPVADPSEGSSKRCQQHHLAASQHAMLEAVDRQKTLAITDSEGQGSDGDKQVYREAASKGCQYNAWHCLLLPQGHRYLSGQCLRAEPLHHSKESEGVGQSD